MKCACENLSRRLYLCFGTYLTKTQQRRDERVPIWCRIHHVWFCYYCPSVGVVVHQCSDADVVASFCSSRDVYLYVCMRVSVYVQSFNTHTYYVLSHSSLRQRRLSNKKSDYERAKGRRRRRRREERTRERVKQHERTEKKICSTLRKKTSRERERGENSQACVYLEFRNTERRNERER